MSLPPGIVAVPVRTPTLPPATHTNTWVVGDGDLAVFDPASPYPEEQALLADALLGRIYAGERVRWLVLTHHHHDHVSGAVALANRLAEVGPRPPIIAHPATAALLVGQVPVDEHWNDRETRDIGGRRLTAHHTPGHAPGHLVFQDADSGAIVAGDMVAGIGTIAISPYDGDLGQYLASLEHMRTLGGSVLLPAHGPALPNPDVILSFYVAHRHQRSDQIRRELSVVGRSTASELVPRVYPELPAIAHGLAAGQITSHLRWLSSQGLASGDDRGWEAR